MNSAQLKQPPENQVPLHAHAAEHLHLIRSTMERSATFRSVPGWGAILMGLLSAAGAWIASWRLDVDWWLMTWIYVATFGCIIGAGALVYKAQHDPIPFYRGAGRRFFLNFAPAIVAGLLLTELFYQSGIEHLMPGMWLMIYGVAVISGGSASVPVIPVCGLFFLLLGAFTVLVRIYLLPPTLATYHFEDLMLALGFGGIHIVGGAALVWRHGS